MNESTAVDRDALYYPYIHIDDENWLKATLLCFPAVRRMIPSNYLPDDSYTVREFCDLTGPRNTPLVSSVDLFSKGAMRAENNLLEKLKANDDFIRSRYSKKPTIQQYGDSADLFRLHNEKIMPGLWWYLTCGPEENALAWPTNPPKDRPRRLDPEGWIAMHPALGSAILSVKAVAIAEDFGLDIVTDSSGAHQAVVTQSEEDIFDSLIGRPFRSHDEAQQVDVDDLTEIVMTTFFDVRKFSPKQIADLVSDGKDLRRFKDALIPFAASIPPIKDTEERKKRLREAAVQISNEWEKYRKSLPKFAADAIFDVAEIKWPDIAGAVFGLSVGAGLGIAIVSYAGVRIWRKYKENSSSPYSYLNRIERLQSKEQTFLSFPPLT